MTERVKQELKLVETRYGELEIGPNCDWFVIKRWRLGAGWNKNETPVLILIPPGYAVTPPDNFYTDNDLFLSSGGEPGNTSRGQTHAGRLWRQFSYHVEAGDWQPHADPLHGHNLLTFLAGVAKRLAEPN
jgi:hypothetical protein